MVILILLREQLGPFGGPLTESFQELPEGATPIAVAHTHPFFSRREAEAANLDQGRTHIALEDRGPQVHLSVEQGLPNFFRTPQGDQIKVVERVNGEFIDRVVSEN